MAAILIVFSNLSFVWRTGVVVLDFAFQIKHDSIAALLFTLMSHAWLIVALINKEKCQTNVERINSWENVVSEKKSDSSYNCVQILVLHVIWWGFFFCIWVKWPFYEQFSSAKPNKAQGPGALQTSCSATAKKSSHTRYGLFQPLSPNPPQGILSLCKLLTFLAVQWLLLKKPKKKPKQLNCWCFWRPWQLLSTVLTVNSPALTLQRLPPNALQNSSANCYTELHICSLSPPPPLRCHDSFVTKMNSSSALQPKQVIWLPQPQIKLVWFNFRFGLLLQPYIKGDIFHYTAKLQACRQRWSTPPLRHRKISWKHYGIYSIRLQLQKGRWCHGCHSVGLLSTGQHIHLSGASIFRSLLSQTLTICW